MIARWNNGLQCTQITYPNNKTVINRHIRTYMRITLGHNYERIQNTTQIASSRIGHRLATFFDNIPFSF